MRTVKRRVRVRNARPTTAFRPRPAALEDRVLLAFGVPGDVLTYHNDNASTGQNLSETTLTPANVNPTGFGKLFTDPVDGFVYGQPLTVSSVPIPNQGTHDVAFVTTQHDSVYAFDAESGAQLWKDSFINPAAGITTVPSGVTNTTDIVPEVGITATPVIDGNTGTLYVVTKTQNVESDGTHYVQKLNALDITSGTVKSSVTIGDTIFNSTTNTYTYVSGPTVPGTGDNSVNGIVHLNALRNNVRSALTLSNGVVYVAESSHGDNRPYNGWLLGFSASTLQPASVFNTAPNGAFTAIWMAGGKPVVDDNGNIYVATGNGTFDAAPSGAQSLGGTGGALGYQGILDSVAVSFRAFTSSVTGLATNGGSFSNETSTAPVDFQGNSGANPPHTYQATLSYDGTTLTETITDLNLPQGMNTVTKSYAVNIPQQVGGSTAFVGFTGGTGGLNAVQDVQTWTYTAGGTTIDHSGGFASHGDLTNNGSATFTGGGAAELTSGQNSQAGSIFTNNQVNVTNFTTTFTFQMRQGTNPIADGMTFTIQANPGGPDYGNSVLRIAPNGSTVTDFFTPFNQAALSAADEDQGSGGVLLLPDSVGSSAHPHLLVQTGKSGNIYLIDRDNMGQYNPNGTGPNNVVQQLTGAIAGGGSYDSPAFFNAAIYYLGDGDVLKEFQIANGLLSTTPVAQATTVFGFPGATPSISANGTSNGIVWVLDNHTYGIPEAPTAAPGVLYAYDASTLQELYNSNDVLNRDQPGNAVKFTVPTVSHGLVYVGSQGSFSAFGLLPPSLTLPNAPANLEATPITASSIRLDWTSTATNATLVKVERSTDGGNTFTVVAEVSPTTTTYLDTKLAASTTYTYEVVATNQLGDSGPSNQASATTLVAAPVLQVSDVLASQINLSWTATAHDHYTVERSTDGTNFAVIASLPPSATTFSDSPSAFGTYFYRVTAFDGPFNSADSNTVSVVLGPINSHVDHSAGFASNSDLTANGSAKFVVPSGSTTTVARLTDGGGNEAGSIFTNNKVGVSTFTTSFTFHQFGTGTLADGFAFVIQGNSPTALGPGGGGLGYGPDSPSGTGGIPNSIAVKFDIFSNQGEGTDSTGLYINGASPTIPAVDMSGSGVVLLSQDVMMATLSYDGTTLTETVMDTVTHATFTHQYTVNIPSIVGGLQAFAGFTGGTGGLASTQDILTWRYDSVEDTTKIHTPSGLKVANVFSSSASTSDVTIDWKANDPYNATGFQVQRSTNGTNFVTIAFVSPNFNTYTDPGLTGGTYFYRVQAFNASTTSAFSNVDSVLVGGGNNPVVVDHQNGFASNFDLTANGSTKFVASGATTVARLTDGGGNEAGTLFTTQRVSIATFNTSFVFQFHDGTVPQADGMTFIIQGNTPTALGPLGGGLGYGPDHPGGTGGIPNSIAVKFDIFSNQGEGINSTGLYLNGASPTVPSVDLTGTGIDLHSGDPFLVNLSYDGTTLTETITDNVTQAMFTTQYTVNIPAAVGGNVGYVGFGGGTGGDTVVADIQAWIYTTQDAQGGGGGASSPFGSSPAIAGAQPAAAFLPGTAGGVSPVLASPLPPGAVDAALARYAEDPTLTQVAKKGPSLLF